MTSEADIAAAVRTAVSTFGPGRLPAGPGPHDAARGVRASEAQRTGLSVERIEQIWARGLDVDHVLAEVRRVQAAAKKGQPTEG